MKLGIYSNKQLTGEQYHNSPGISKSGLDRINKSPLHYWAKYLDPDREPEETTPAKLFGNAFHQLLGEPDEFHNNYMLAPAKESYAHAVSTIDDIISYASANGISLPKGKKDQMWKALSEKSIEAVLWDDLRAKLIEGKRVLTTESWDKAHKMRDSVMRQPIAKALIKNGEFEKTFVWRDSITGEVAKCRTDYFIEREGIILDWKTAEDASYEAFQRSMLRYRYRVQHPFYLDGVQQYFPHTKVFIFLVIEKEYPHAVATYYLHPLDVEQGRLIYMKDMQRYAEAKRANDWMGYSNKIQMMELPGYSRKEIA